VSGTWKVTGHGLATVARLELRQRVRSSRWLVVLAIWVAVIGFFTWLTDVAVDPAPDAPAGVPDPSGGVMFSVVAFLVLSLGVLVAPALSATSINGDRAAGTLATVQVTLLSPAEIALGKLLAAWGTSLAFLVTAVPFIVWAYVAGGTPFGRVLTTLVLVAVTFAVVCAIGLGWSAVCARTGSSAVLTYLSVAGLCVGTVILFGLSVPVVSSVEQVRVLQPGAITASPATAADCVQTAQEMSVTHTERTWWLLAASPYVVVADAAPAPDLPAGVSAFDPLSAIRDGVRSAKAGPPEVYDWCTPSGTAGPDGDRLADVGAAWPWGLGLNLLLGAAGALVSVRRLRTPMRSLPRGTRVA
jgi:ABC-type transport system involved in multi-copper enzyme maturation permease subunit